MSDQVIGFLLPPSLLLIGAGLTMAVATFRPLSSLARWLHWIVAAVIGGALVWLLLHPHMSEGPWQIEVGLHGPVIALQAVSAGRSIGIAVMLLALGAVLISLRRQEAANADTPAQVTGDWALLLALLAVALFCVLPANLYTVALAWTALDGVTAVAWILTTRKEQGALIHWGAGATATLLLWSAALTTSIELAQSPAPLGVAPAGWAGTALVLAATLRLAPYPFHLGRPYLVTETYQNSALKIALQAIPLAVGAWLLVQVPISEILTSFPKHLLTTLLLTGMVGSSLLAWLPSENPRAIRWVVGGQAALTVLTAVWIDQEATLAQAMTTILGGGLLLLLADGGAVTVERKVITAIGLAALTGLPLTLGGDSRPALFQCWSSESWGLYLVLGAGSWLLLLGSAARPLFAALPPPPERTERINVAVGLALPTIALLARSGPVASRDFVVWLAILLPIVGGSLLAAESDSLKPLQQQAESRLHPLLALHWLRRLSGRLASLVGRLANAVHHVLEGEGALLWLLVLLALAWLLFKDATPG